MYPHIDYGGKTYSYLYLCLSLEPSMFSISTFSLWLVISTVHIFANTWILCMSCHTFLHEHIVFYPLLIVLIIWLIDCTILQFTSFRLFLLGLDIIRSYQFQITFKALSNSNKNVFGGEILSSLVEELFFKLSILKNSSDFTILIESQIIFFL